MRFVHITAEDGLSNDWIRAILRDSRGFLWVGTQDGLDRYDGASFKRYRHDAADPDSLPSPVVGVLHEDPRGRLWIGTSWGQAGLALYDRDRDRFVRYSAGEGSGVDAIVDAADGRLWIGTDNGLHLIRSRHQRL